MTATTGTTVVTPQVRHDSDFDLHGIVGIRLVDAREQDVATVRRQLGPLQHDFDRAPDITIRFVDSLPQPSRRRLTYVGIGDGAFDEDSFYVLRGKGQVPAKAMIPFDMVGGPLEIVCERRMPAVPHLLTVINFAAMAKGVLPLHASAVTADGVGVLVTGWSKGGKTETLLACMAEGAEFVGDEWIYLTADGRMLGLPEPIRLWSWQLRQMRRLLAERPARDRARLQSWDRIAGIMERSSRTRLPGAALVARCLPAVRRQAYLQVPPVELFGQAAVKLSGRLDAVVLVVSSDSPDTSVVPIASSTVAARMAASLAAERAMFMEHYWQFRFAFPDRRSQAVEAAEERELSLLHAVLGDTPAAMVVHPYPCEIGHLGHTVLSGVREAMR